MPCYVPVYLPTAWNGVASMISPLSKCDILLHARKASNALVGVGDERELPAAFLGISGKRLLIFSQVYTYFEEGRLQRCRLFFKAHAVRQVG